MLGSGPSLDRRQRRLAGSLTLALALALAGASAATAARLVAVGDVHGDLAAFQAILREAGVVDAKGAWVAGDTVLVQLGDLIDRGPSMRSAFDFVMALDKQAAKRGGRVVSLLGNHEVMNILGDLRYVVPENYAEFAEAASERRRAEAWGELVAWQKRRAQALGQPEPPSGPDEQNAWLAAHPLGFLEHRRAFGPDGTYGRWLRARPALYRAQRSVFLHGGLSPALAGSSLEQIDQRVHDEIAAFDADQRALVKQGLVLSFFTLPEMTLAVDAELAALAATEAAERAAAEAAGKKYATPARVAERRALCERFRAWGSWSITSADGPLWFRGFAQWTDAEGSAEIPKLRAVFGVDRFVVAHTVQPTGRIVARFDGAVFLIDTGMLATYVKGGRASALELADGVVTAIYVAEPRQVLWRAAAAASTAPAPAASAKPPAASTAPAPATSSKPSLAASTAPASAASTAPAPAASTAPAPASPAGARVFLGPDGAPLPFKNDAELLEFLKTAKVTESKDIGEGITRPRRLTMEKDGVRARAIFRNIEQENRAVNLPGGRRELAFRDYHGFEPAAYQLGLLLGLDDIPPSIPRRHGGDEGSVQIWIEKGMTEGRRLEAKTAPPDALRWRRQMQMMLVWDALVGNTDRNQGNLLFTPEWHLWLIDHTRAFRRSTYLPNPEKIVWCERGFYEKLRSVSDAEIRDRVRGHLNGPEIAGLLERRKRLVELLEKLVEQRGESAVLFTWPK